jgi:leucyl aminopeptidase
VELRFVANGLRALDDASAEVVACAIWRDERPVRGLAGLLDWRLAGRVSRLLRERFLKGELGEVLCLPGRPRLPFDKVVVVGAGERAAFDDEAFRAATGAILRTLEGLKVERAVVELPGRAGEHVAPERAAELLFESTRDSDAHDTWFLVETAQGQAKIASRASDERRRAKV